MTFQPIDDPVDYVELAGQRSPGICEVLGGSSPRRWDERRGYGFSGSTLIFRGVGLCRPTLKLRLYTAQDWADWHEWSRLVQRPPLGERARALDIVHPILEDLGVRSVVVEDVLQPQQTADGEWTIEVRLIEYRRREAALERIDGATAAVTDPIDKQILLNNQELRALSQELAS